jgi:hypothetical protein
VSKIRKQRGVGAQAEEITSLGDWERLAPPKSRGQWQDGRSAKETAVAWLEGGGEELPEEVSALFAAHGDFGPVLDWEAEPEARLRLDGFAGEPRNSDLVVKARDQHGSYLIAVEAKADESFGDTLIGTVGSAIERYVENSVRWGSRALCSLQVHFLARGGKGIRNSGACVTN